MFLSAPSDYVMKMARPSSGNYEIYAIKDGYIRVNGRIKKRILHALQEKEMTPKELAPVAGRAMSTISKYLEDMVDDGLIGYRVNENDGRSRIYYLLGAPLMTSKPADPKAMELSSEILSDITEDHSRASGLILRSLILTYDGVGLSIGPVLYSIGCDMAYSILVGRQFRSESVALEMAKQYFDQFGLGEMTIYSRDPITILFRDTVDLTQTSASAMASFVEGFVSTVMTSCVGVPYVKTDQEVFGVRNNYIRMTFESDKSSGTVLQ